MDFQGRWQMVQVQSHFKQIPPSTCGFDVCPSSCEPIRCQRSACVAQDGADAQMTRQKLSEEGLIAEDWGWRCSHGGGECQEEHQLGRRLVGKHFVGRRVVGGILGGFLAWWWESRRASRSPEQELPAGFFGVESIVATTSQIHSFPFFPKQCGHTRG